MSLSADFPSPLPAATIAVNRPLLFSHSTCSTCRKARAWLQQQGIAVEVREIIGTPPSRQQLAAAMAQLGRPRLFNTSGQSYRALGAAAVRALSDDQALDALAADGKLIRRPFLITPGGATLTGFQPQDWQDLLAAAPDPDPAP